MLLAVAVLLTCALPPAAHASSLSTELIGIFPQNVGEFAYADLRQARYLSWYPQLKEQMLPEQFRQFEKSLASAGVDPDLQVEELAWALVPARLPTDSMANTDIPTGDEVVGVALGPFRPDAVEAYFTAKKLSVVNVRDYPVYSFSGASGGDGLFFCFLDSNTAAFGQRKELERLIAVRYGDEQSLLTNAELASLISQRNSNSVVWAVLSAPYARLAMRQLAPQIAEFPQAQQIISKLRGLTIEIDTGTGIQAHFEAMCALPDDANVLGALLQAGFLYQHHQAADSNPDLAAVLDQAQVATSADRLDVSLALTDDQVVALIQRNTFVIHP
jgi:hypothetical protein